MQILIDIDKTIFINQKQGCNQGGDSLSEIYLIFEGLFKAN